MNQAHQTRQVMRGKVYHLCHNRRVEDYALAEANRLIRAKRQRLPWLWRARGALRDWWAARFGEQAKP